MQHVDLPSGGVLQHSVEGGALVAPLGAADAGVLVEIHHLPARTVGNRFQLSLLILGGLTVGGNPEVDADALHWASLHGSQQHTPNYTEIS
jgi:hypothetical protein